MFRISYYARFLITALVITFNDSIQSENSTQFWNETIYDYNVIERENTNSGTIKCWECNRGDLDFETKCEGELYRHKVDCPGACAIDYERGLIISGGFTKSKEYYLS